jgi:hypothetical protein
MKLIIRLLIMITIVVAATDLIVYFHLSQHPENLTLTYTLLVIFITLLPIFIILSFWHWRKLL